MAANRRDLRVPYTWRQRVFLAHRLPAATGFDSPRLNSECTATIGQGTPHLTTIDTHRRLPWNQAVFAFGSALVLVLLILASFSFERADAAQKGLFDSGLNDSRNDSAPRRSAVEDLRSLGVRWVRVSANWRALEPQAEVYDQSEIQRLDGLVQDIDAAGARVMLGVCSMPDWAKDSSFAGDPGSAGSIRADALDNLSRLGEMLASHFGDRVRDIECWNEPNLWACIYPQRTANDPNFGARTYLRMLKALHKGVQRGDARVRVIAGATAPIGLNDRLRTSPQRFARFLKENGAQAYFEVYAHHPYTPGGTVNQAPDGRPNDPSTTVTLYNLRTLLRLFPSKPFYLTEYAYNTSPSSSFGGFSISEAKQAQYLRTAYTYVRRYKQVKVLMWFEIHDRPPLDSPADRGSYTGLRRSSGTRKPSWFVYAGGNRVSLLAPFHARQGSRITLQGRVTCASIGGVPSSKLTVLGRRLGTTRWYAQATVVAGADGRYTVRLPFRYAAQYRVKWSVVRTSIVRTVRNR